MMQPSRVGGAELDYVALVEICAELARGCGSTGWTFANLSCHHWILAMMPEGAQKRLWDEDPDVLIASSFIFPCGKATAVKGGYKLSGRWPFSSGVNLSTWNMLGGIVPDGDQPGQRIFLLPDSDYETIDTWHAAGLQGTGSNDVACKEVFVPEEMTVAVADIKGGPTPGSALNPGPLYELPVFALFPLILSGVALGNAEAVLDDYVMSMRKRSATYSGAKLSELQSVQIKIGAAGARLDVARRVMVAICEEAMDEARRGVVPDMETKLRYRRDTAFATELCTQAIDMLYTASGAQALFTRNALQRQFRDAHAMANHIAFNMDIATAAYGRVALGLESDNPII
jgi:3-hydroxy-9,10-secoandrosta-1,3,5(10)-triene-9,17-dione monooxygenase